MVSIGEEGFDGFAVGEDGVAEALHCTVECALPHESGKPCCVYNQLTHYLAGNWPRKTASERTNCMTSVPSKAVVHPSREYV